MASATPAAPARATLDFFGAQQDARRRTAWLVLAFAAALALVVALVYLAAVAVLAWGALRAGRGSVALLQPGLLAGVAFGVGAVVGTGAAWHSATLGLGGGEVLARRLGGRRVERSTGDPAERRLVNVAEEMALAAGLPVPALYVLDAEPGLNAFAAGDAPGRAVVAVTRGALDRLSRDQLQGVVAHELAHVLNGDTRLDARLLALVGGLGILVLLGRGLLRLSGRGRRSVGAVALAGLALLVAGWVGVLCGKLVRYAVARQREWLADACAVQFTRNPDGLGGALRVILAEGAAVRAPLAADAAHLFFAAAVGGALERLLATHPPLVERIRRLQPRGPVASGPAAPGAPAPGAAGVVPLAPLAGSQGPAPAAASPARAAGAAALLARLPPELVAAAREPYSVRALCCGLSLEPGLEARARALAALPADVDLRAELARQAPLLAGLGRTERMALLALALPSLDRLSPAQVAAVRVDLAALGPPRTPFALAVRRVVAARLEAAGRAPGYGLRTQGSAGAAPLRSLDDALPECLQILAPLAWFGDRAPAAAAAALAAGARALGAGPWRLPPPAEDAAALERLDAALAQLQAGGPALRERVLAACVATALADGRVTADEAELLRAIAAALGLPMPHLAPSPVPCVAAAQPG